MTNRYPFTAIKEKLIERQGRVLDFAVGRRTIPLPETIDSWIHANAGLALKPAGRAEADEFAQAASAFLAREYCVEIPAGRILPAPGGRAAMSAFIACALNPAEKVLVTEPGYPAFARLARHRHAKVLVSLLNPENAFVPELDSIVDADDGPFRVIAVNYPNNPTGATLSSGVMSRLNEIAAASTIFFNDATYGPLVYDEHPGSFLGNSTGKTSRIETVELHSFSKLFPLGPVAVSFLAGSEETMRAVSTYSEFAWSPLSKLQLKVTAMCLQDSARLQELRGFFPAQLQKLRQTLISIGLEPYPTPAGVYALCQVPPQIAGKLVNSAEEAASRLMDEFDLAVFPLDTPQHSYLRFSSLYLAEDLERLSRLGAQLQVA
ncbi:MAG: pyridoxal phosphate-dependent aminotransferase [Woeseia sp.]